MKILGALFAVAAAAAVIPYKIERNPEDGSISAKGLIYDFKLTKDENGESNVDLNFNLKKFRKEGAKDADPDPDPQPEGETADTAEEPEKNAGEAPGDGE